MIKKFVISLVTLYFINCVSLGKVGYLVPAENDTKEVSDEVAGQKCGTLVINIFDDVNRDLESQGQAATSQKNVAVVFEQGAFSGCMQLRKLK